MSSVVVSKVKIFIFGIFLRVFGKDVSKRLLFAYNKRLFEKNRLIFIHIPKAAGTSIAYAIYGKRAGHFSFLDAIKYLGEGEVTKYTTFTVVRDPYERLLSSYFYAIHGGGADGAIANPSLYRKPVFHSFSSFINNWLIHQDLSSVDYIFRPQHLFITDETQSRITVNYLFKIEDIDSIQSFLTRVTRNEVKIGVKNRSKRLEAVNNVYSPQLKSVVASIYAKDFELLGYRI